MKTLMIRLTLMQTVSRLEAISFEVSDDCFGSSCEVKKSQLAIPCHFAFFLDHFCIMLACLFYCTCLCSQLCNFN